LDPARQPLGDVVDRGLLMLGGFFAGTFGLSVGAIAAIMLFGNAAGLH
jgi:hypothetical protein